MSKSRRNMISAVAFSLAVHIAAVVFFLHKAPGDICVPEALDKMNMVWVTLETKINDGTAGNYQRPFAIFSQKTQKQITAKERTENIATRREQFGSSLRADVPQFAVLPGNDAPVAPGAEEDRYNFSNSVSVPAASLAVPAVAEAFPLYRENLPPAYPAVARMRGYEGIVLVVAEVLPDGCVGNMRIKKSSGHDVLDQSAMEAVKPWKFEPAKRGGKPFTVWVELPIKFILHDDNSQS